MSLFSGIMATLLFISLIMLRRHRRNRFRQQTDRTPLVERAALASEA